MGNEYVELVTVSGRMEAEIIHAMLEAYGIDTELSFEAAASIYGLGVGPTAEVDILVSSEQLDEAQKLLDDYQSDRLDEG